MIFCWIRYLFEILLLVNMSAACCGLLCLFIRHRMVLKKKYQKDFYIIEQCLSLPRFSKEGQKRIGSSVG